MTRNKCIILFIFSIVVCLFFMASCCQGRRDRLLVAGIEGDEAWIQKTISKAKIVESDDPVVNNIKVVVLSGTPFEMGFQHGYLLREDIEKLVSNTVSLLNIAIADETWYEIWSQISPYISIEELEEMRGLAIGANIPLELIHFIHCIPIISEYGKNKDFLRPALKKLLEATMCSNSAVWGNATKNGNLYQLRVLDWARWLGIQKYPVVIIHKPDKGYKSVTFSYAGFIGCISGMNEKGLCFGEQGRGDAENETLQGFSFPFLFRKLMREAGSLDQVTDVIKTYPKTCKYAFAVSDSRSEQKALIYLVNPGETPEVIILTQGNPHIPNTVYYGYDDEIIHQEIFKYYGKINPEVIMKMAKRIGMPDENMQNVIFSPQTMECWVSNAAVDFGGEKGQAYNQGWFYIDLKKYF